MNFGLGVILVKGGIMEIIGETGSGKTTVCQLLSLVWDRYLHMLNYHQHIETSEFPGGFRSVRDQNSIAANFEEQAPDN